MPDQITWEVIEQHPQVDNSVNPGTQVKRTSVGIIGNSKFIKFELLEADYSGGGMWLKTISQQVLPYQ